MSERAKALERVLDWLDSMDEKGLHDSNVLVWDVSDEPAVTYGDLRTAIDALRRASTSEGEDE